MEFHLKIYVGALKDSIVNICFVVVWYHRSMSHAVFNLNLHFVSQSDVFIPDSQVPNVEFINSVALVWSGNQQLIHRCNVVWDHKLAFF